MMTVTINNTTITAPGSWNELTLTELHTLYNLAVTQPIDLYLPIKKEAADFVRLEATKYLLNLDDATLNSWLQDCLEYETDGHYVFLDELRQLSAAVAGWVVSEENSQVVLGLTKCPYPKIRLTNPTTGKKIGLYAPADALSNINFYELGTTFTLFRDYLVEKDETKLHRLLAVLYRPAKPRTKDNERTRYGGDIRQPYYQNETLIESHIQLIASLPPAVKGLLLFWFSSCFTQIVTQHPDVFAREEDNRIAGEEVGDNYGWAGIFMSLAGGIVHLDQVVTRPWQVGVGYLSFLETERKKAIMRRPPPKT